MHEYVRPIVVEVTPERESVTVDDFIPQEYIAQVIDLNANVVELHPNKDQAA